MIARVTLVIIAVAFVVAEIVRPTTLQPKKVASRALLVSSQSAAAPRAFTVDPELLADLPRIHPDAPGTLARKAGGDIVGTILDPYTRRPGIAIFPIVDESRISAFSAVYRDGRFVIRPLSPLQDGNHTVAVGLIATDQRGYFRSARTLETIAR